MADNGSKMNYRSSYFISPRLFTGFVPKGCNETESSMSSPTSILDMKNPFRSDPNTPKPESKNYLNSTRVGLGLIDALLDDKPDSNLSKFDRAKVVFGSQLKIQVPPPPPSILSPLESPKSPYDFGIKTRNSHVDSYSPGLSRSPFSSLSASEIELSEDYTCVISYGPNPKTTHIFDDCVVESCCGVVKFSESRKENGFLSNRSMSYPSESFLSVCYSCKKNLGQGKDIYMYRGEKAFCSSECRYKEMMIEEESSDWDNVYGNVS